LEIYFGNINIHMKIQEMTSVYGGEGIPMSFIRHSNYTHHQQHQQNHKHLQQGPLPLQHQIPLKTRRCSYSQAEIIDHSFDLPIRKPLSVNETFLKVFYLIDLIFIQAKE
jgi:hypothetical protein